MKKMLKAVVLVSMLVAMSGVAIAQESLKEVIEQENLGWIVNDWTATTDDGDVIELAWKWAADGHALTSAFKMGEDSSVGLVYLDADAQAAKQIRVDNEGRATKATWEPQYGDAVAKTELFDEYGQSTDIAYVFSKINASSMKLSVYKMEYGEMSNNAWLETTFKAKTAAEKRKARAAAKKKQTASAYGSLKSIAEDEGLAWMVKAWKTTTDEGQEIEIGWKWGAAGHAITSAFKMGENSSVGLISLDADAQVGKQISVDSKGHLIKATWEPQYGEVITKTQMFNQNDEATDVAISYSKENASTMKVKVYGVEYGSLSDNPWFEADFKRKTAGGKKKK